MELLTSLDGLPALTRSWSDDALVIETARCPFRAPGLGAHGSVLRVLDRIDLTGRRIGAFHCCPSDAATSPEDRLADYQRRRGGTPARLHLGAYGPGEVVGTEDGIGLLEPGRAVPTPLAPTFEGFVLAQANAVQARRTGADRWAVAEQCTAVEAFRGVDVARVFAVELA